MPQLRLQFSFVSNTGYLVGTINWTHWWMFQFSFSYNRINCKRIKLYYLLLNTQLSKKYIATYIYIYSHIHLPMQIYSYFTSKERIFCLCDCRLQA